MKHLRKLAGLLFLIISLTSSAQRKISECTIVYDIQVQTNSQEPRMADMFNGATTTVFIKGPQSRSEMVSSLGVQSTIIDSRTGNVVVLKEYGEQKYLIRMNKLNWEEVNQKYAGVTFTDTDEFKTISNYKCRKAIGKLKDGTTFSVYYTTELTPENKEFDYVYKNLPGLAMEFETNLGSIRVKYTVSRIGFNTVPAAKFDLPKTGFRELTYEESMGKKVNQ